MLFAYTTTCYGETYRQKWMRRAVSRSQRPSWRSSRNTEKLKEHGERFYVTSEEGDHARIYPMKFWGEIEEKLAKVSSYNKAKQKFLTRTNYYGQVVEIDGQGRVLIPAVLREAAQMKGDVEVMGQLTYLEVWNHTRFMDNM